MLEISSLAFLEIQKLPTFVRAFSICFSQVTHTLPPLFSVLTSHSLPLSLTLRKEEQQEVPSTKSLSLSLSLSLYLCLCLCHTHNKEEVNLNITAENDVVFVVFSCLVARAVV
jgi:hypothetical protein